jgi:hypothetical protein
MDKEKPKAIVKLPWVEQLNQLKEMRDKAREKYNKSLDRFKILELERKKSR